MASNPFAALAAETDPAAVRPALHRAEQRTRESIRRRIMVALEVLEQDAARRQDLEGELYLLALDSSAAGMAPLCTASLSNAHRAWDRDASAERCKELLRQALGACGGPLPAPEP